MVDLKRREVLKASAAVVAVSASATLWGTDFARAAAVSPPVVDRLAVRVLIDGAVNNFLRPAEVKGVKLEPPPRAPNYRRALHNQWGLSLYLESQRGNEQRSVMVDFGYTPDALINNMELVGADPRKLEALIVSHGHYDHFGGLMGFLDQHRGVLPAELTLYSGGEDNFCRRHAGTAAQLTEFGALDRRELAARNVKIVLAETPTVVGHAFTTGKISRVSKERILPNTFVEFAMTGGLGCNAGHYTPAELQGKIVPDEHLHEHATCFNVKDRGLVVISSCGHVGIVNSARQAQEVSGVQKVHALVGGFHLGPAPADYLNQVLGEIKALDPDVIVPMHCSGENFIRAVGEQMPEKLLVSYTGARVVFGA
jgi:7,8-dihydropterin-6-yl-methyl-4-(beta-D-ribofuranosyl)aminobenzene 5'-phosphate synthase